MRDRAIAVIAAIAATFAIVGGTVAATTTGASGATNVEVLGASGPGPAHSNFGIFTRGVGNTARGQVTVWQGTCAGTCTKWQLLTIKVTCVQFPAANDVVITGTTSYRGTPETVVTEAVDNSNPTNSTHPDLLRFSYPGFITPTGTPGCDTPQLAPVPLTSGDLRVPA